MKITILASGSKGNSTLIETGSKNILIDAGLPLINLEKRNRKTITQYRRINNYSYSYWSYKRYKINNKKI